MRTSFRQLAASASTILAASLLPLAAVDLVTLPAPDQTPEGWSPRTPRAEIAPNFSVEKSDNNTHLVLQSPGDKGCNGHWAHTFEIEGSKHYHFQAFRLAENVATPNQSILVRIEWSDADGNRVSSPHPVNATYFGTGTDHARPDFPRDQGLTADGWTEVSDTYLAPPDATQAEVQLTLRWTPNGRVAWRDITMEACPAPKPRKVILATVHSDLRGGESALQNLDQLKPLIQEAGAKNADLLVLPECVDTKSNGLTVAEGADSLDECTAFLGDLAKEYNMYIVAGLHEREDNLIYNVAVLLNPDGELAGSYRKCTLPREEIAGGVQPGREYPVFDTRFGKLGMMVCYDVFHPEVARNLALNGAEIIAVPVWGANPTLAAARCIENHVYLVTSTYTDHDHDWMKSAIWDREGQRLAEGTKWNTLVLAEVDLNQPTYWRHLGDFQSRIQRERPLPPESGAHSGKPVLP
ncbi:MAG: carbon-nitrogen hydrolase family protein [Verrucomicrobiota bacterium]